jgi:microcystin-dependent protein
MPNLFDALSSPEYHGVFKGVFAEDATGPNDEVLVNVPDYDPNRPFGPCPFVAQPLAAGGVLLPNRGDDCLVAFDEDDNPHIVSWRATDPTSSDGGVRAKITERAQDTLIGGGLIKYNGSGELSWSVRFLVIAIGSGLPYIPAGHFTITMPGVGTVIPGVGCADVVVTAGGIPITPAWSALYYKLPLGQNQSVRWENFRMVGYSASGDIPDDWIMIAQRNDDVTVPGQSHVKLGTGAVIPLGQQLEAKYGVTDQLRLRYLSLAEAGAVTLDLQHIDGPANGKRSRIITQGGVTHLQSIDDGYTIALHTAYLFKHVLGEFVVPKAQDGPDWVGAETLNPGYKIEPGGSASYPAAKRTTRWMRTPSVVSVPRRLSLFYVSFDPINWHAGGGVEVTVRTHYPSPGFSRCFLNYGWNAGAEVTVIPLEEAGMAYLPKALPAVAVGANKESQIVIDVDNYVDVSVEVKAGLNWVTRPFTGTGGIAWDGTITDLAVNPQGFASLGRSGRWEPGDVKMSARSIAAGAEPPGWLLCDGRAVSRTTYATLFAAIGAVHGAGDGATTFNLPDYRGRSPLGTGTGTATYATAHTVGQRAGTESHVLTLTEMPAHSHGVTDPGHAHGLVNNRSTSTSAGGVGAGSFGGLLGRFNDNGYWVDVGVNGATTGVTIQSSGSDQPHNNMHPYTGTTFLVKT